MKFEIMDTTLRDGEQTPSVSFADNEKLNIAKILLDEVKVDRIEVASARISQGELEGTKLITKWCKENDYLDKVEVLGFTDYNKSVDWVVESGCKVINLLCKGSLDHVIHQFNKTAEEHIDDVIKTIRYGKEKGLTVNVYFEIWSSGIIDTPDYVFQLTDALKKEGINRFLLPDTLGILNPEETYKYCKLMIDRYPDLSFEFHAHNDYDLANANTFMAIKAGVHGVHTTVNGLGERTGNAALSSVVAMINDFFDDINLSCNEGKLNKISNMVEAFSGIRIPLNQPIIGDNVFTQTCGVHADGDNKGNLYFNKLLPERFIRQRKYALGKTSGKASIVKNLKELGIELDDDSVKKITRRIVELGDKKENITTYDLPYIISDVLNDSYVEEKVELVNYYICSAHGLNPVATLSIKIDNDIYEETSTGDGQYDAFMEALSCIYKKLGKELPELVDYIVSIPPGGRTSALVESVIKWKSDVEFKTRGLDSDQTASAIKATIRMLNLID